MEVAEIVEQLRWFNQRFELDAVKAALASREEVTPALLGILEEVAERGAAFDESDDYMAHLYAMFLLAQFRETRAYPIMLRIALLPGDLLESLFGDSITESFGQVLASVCGGDIQGIQSLIENPDADEWVRGAALGGLVTLVAAGIKSREEILGYFAELFHGKLTDKNDIVWSELVAYSTDLYAEELLGEIEKAYEQELVDPTFIGLEDVREDLAKGKDWAMERLADNPHRLLIDDTVKEMAGWASFSEEEQRKPQAGTPAFSASNSRWLEAPSGFKRVAPKVGRNDPCPCASGKKYKKCCGQ